MNEQEKKEWTDALKHNLEGLSKSAIFMQLWTDNITKDPLACMQMGLAMMLDKPIHIAVPVGSKLPENLRKVAASIEYYDGTTSGIEHAARKILKNANIGGPT